MFLGFRVAFMFPWFGNACCSHTLFIINSCHILLSSSLDLFSYSSYSCYFVFFEEEEKCIALWFLPLHRPSLTNYWTRFILNTILLRRMALSFLVLLRSLTVICPVRYASISIISKLVWPGVPPTPLFGQIIEAYKIYTCQLKPKSISKIVCFELMCHASLVFSRSTCFNISFGFVAVVLGFISALGDKVLLRVFWSQ